MLLIVCLGLFLRLYKLDSIPPGLTWDEAALGYNAYSISKTLKDEYGTFLPLTLKSFGDYKPALYAYLDIPFIMIFGLNEIAVRLPSVLAGIGLIILCYLLTHELFKNKWLSLSTAFFAAISPLSIQFSRAAWESNIAFFLNVLGLYLFIKALQKSIYYIPSAAVFSLSMLCYQASKIFVPIILLGILIFFYKQIKFSKAFFAGLGILITIIVSVYIATFLLNQSNRLASQNFFAYRTSDEAIQKIVQEDGLEIGSPEFEILHGEWWAFASGLIERYVIYFSPKTLFIDGDYSPRHSVPDLGILNLYGLILIPLGFYFLLAEKKETHLLSVKKEKSKAIILFWLFTASIPAVLSRDLISMVRALNLAFPFIILEGFGLYFLVTKLSSLTKIKNYLVSSALLTIIAANLLLYTDFYFVHLPKELSDGWLYGYKQVLSALPDTSKYARVVISDAYGQPYIYYLFYKQYPPEKFQSQAVLEQSTTDVGTVRKIDNIEFRHINWPDDRGLENTLLVGNELALPEQDLITEKKTKKLNEITFLDGKNAFKIVENGYNQK